MLVSFNVTGGFGSESKFATYVALKGSFNSTEPAEFSTIILPVWQFNKRYWPDSHMKVVQRIF